MASKIQLKRSSVAGKQPNTTNLSVGELALNIADGKIYSSNGSDVFEPAGNVSSLYIGNSSVYSFANSTDLSTNTLHINTKINIGNAAGFDFGNLAVIEIDASQNTYVQTIIQNANTGNNASGDLVVTTDNGNDSFGYVDLGINSSTYDRSEFSIAGAGVAYLYASDSDLAIGTAKNKELVFHANGTTSSDRKFTINATAITIANVVGIYTTGSYGNAGQVLTSNGINGAPYWSTVTGGTSNSTSITIRTIAGVGGGVNTTVTPTTLNIDESANVLHLVDQGSGSAYLYANLSAYATTGSVTANADAAYTNAVSYIDGKILTVNSAITGNAATAYSNSVSYTDGKISTVNSAITANATTAYSNAVSYTDSKILTANGAITGNAATAYSNSVSYIDGKILTANGAITGNAATAYTNAVSYTDGKILTANGAITGNAATAYANAVSYTDGKISTANSAITGNAATAYSNSVSYVDGKISTANSAITGNAATAYSNAISYIDAKILTSNGAISGNSDAAYTNAVSYTDGKILTANGAITGNAATAYSNSISYTDGKILTANSAITGNAATAYSNSVSYTDGKILTANSAITGNAATAYTNATNFASNASNISTGTLPYSVIPSNVVNTTSSFTFSNTITFNGNVTVNNSLKDSSGNSGSFGQYLSSDSNHKPVWVSPYYYTTQMYDYTAYGLGWSNIAPNQNASTLGFRSDVQIPYGSVWMYVSNDGLVDSLPITITSPNNKQTPMMWITIDGSGPYDVSTNPNGTDYWFNITPPPAGA
jgi:hypothetical protein